MMNFNEILEKTYDDIKNIEIRKFYTFFTQHIFDICSYDEDMGFFNETSILVFAELPIFHSIYVKMSFGKVVRKITT